jgi:hypothetical protein
MTAALEGCEWSAARPGRTLPPGKDPVPILQEAGWAPGPVWTGGKSRPHRESIPYRPARSQSLYRLSCPAHSRGKALLFLDHGTRRGWVVSSTPRPHFTPEKDPVPILQEAGWAPGPVWTGGKSRPHRESIPYRPARSQSLYRLSYRARGI